LRKRELQDSVNAELRWEQVQRKNAQERVQYLANEKRDLLKAIELLADRLRIRENYMVDNEWEETQVFDTEQLVQDLFTDQQNTEVILEDEARMARLYQSAKETK
jgi:hypothetical protein